MKLVLIFLGQMIAKGVGVVAGIFAAGGTDTVGRRPHVGTGATQILVEIVRHLIENFFQLRGGGTEKNDVAGGTVHVGDTAAPEIPKIT